MLTVLADPGRSVARLRSRAASAIHGPTPSTHNLFWQEPLSGVS